MSPSELKYKIETTGKDSHFFDRKTMRFFGDSIANYGVRSAVVKSPGTPAFRRCCGLTYNF